MIARRAITNPNRFALINRFYHQLIAYNNVTGSGPWHEVGRRRPDVRRAVPSKLHVRRSSPDLGLTVRRPLDELNINPLRRAVL